MNRSVESYIYFHEMQNKFYCDVFESNIRRPLPATQNLTGQSKYMYEKRRKVLKNRLNKLYLYVEKIKYTVGHLNSWNKTCFCPYPGLILSNYLKVNYEPVKPKF